MCQTFQKSPQNKLEGVLFEQGVSDKFCLNCKDAKAQKIIELLEVHASHKSRVRLCCHKGSFLWFSFNCFLM